MKALYANCTLSVTQAADGLSMGTTSCRLVCHKFNTQTTWSSQHLQQTLRNKYEKKQQNCRHGRLANFYIQHFYTFFHKVLQYFY